MKGLEKLSEDIEFDGGEAHAFQADEDDEGGIGPTLLAENDAEFG